MHTRTAVAAAVVAGLLVPAAAVAQPTPPYPEPSHPGTNLRAYPLLAPPDGLSHPREKPFAVADFGWSRPAGWPAALAS